MDSNIQQIKSEMDLNKRRIDELNVQINDLQKQIEEKKKSLVFQKELLAEMIRAYYEDSQQAVANTFLDKANVSAFMVSKDELSQMSDKITELMDDINKIKSDLENQAASLELKKQEIVSLHNQLENKSSDLSSTLESKQNLLDQTKGEQERYAQLLARVEAQKQDLLSVDELSIAGGLSADSYEKPPVASFAPLSWYYSQKDSRWGNSKIGNSNSFMKDYGCAVTSVAMVLASHGDSISPGALAKQKIFSWDLISWPQSWSSVKLTLSENGKSHGNINWSVIDNELKNNNPVIVYIGKTVGKGGHYVMIHHKAINGKYVVHDPYFGANIYLDTSRALVGLMGTSSGTRMDQMIIYK
jgi:hypothetical protein